MAERGKILVVEDDRLALRLLAAVLTGEGYSVQTAASGGPAVIAVGACPPDLILLDIAMPGIDGFEVCRQLKEREETRHIPIIFISAASEVRERIEGFRLGAVDFVAKPFQRDELLARVRTHLTLAQLRAELAQKASSLELLTENLQRNSERLNLALESAHMGTWVLDLATGRFWRSRLQDRIFGSDSAPDDWDLEKFLGHIIPPERDQLRQQLAQITVGAKVNLECQIVREDNQGSRWIDLRGQAYGNEQGKPVHLMGVAMDITERKRADQARRTGEAQRSLAHKLESVGRLAAGLAHEINTPVQFIADNTNFLQRAADSMSAMLGAYRELAAAAAAGCDILPLFAGIREMEERNEIDYLLGEIPRTYDEILRGLQRVTRIVRSLKEFSHPEQSSRHLADLNQGIITTVEVSRHEWEGVAELRTELDPGLPGVPLVVDELNLVLLNLIENAAHSIREARGPAATSKGLITIRTTAEPADILIEVEDNGTGIPPSAEAHIFEPFFTTKGIGQGTGQGLAMVRNIVVHGHQGSIAFTTAAGVGTTFSIRLPRAAPGVVALAGLKCPAESRPSGPGA